MDRVSRYRAFLFLDWRLASLVPSIEDVLSLKAGRVQRQRIGEFHVQPRMVSITKKLEAVIAAHPELRDRIVNACYQGCSACEATEDLALAVPHLDAPYMRVYCVRCVRCLPK